MADRTSKRKRLVPDDESAASTTTTTTTTPRSSVASVKEAVRAGLQKRLDEKIGELQKKASSPGSGKAAKGRAKSLIAKAAEAASPRMVDTVQNSSFGQSPRAMSIPGHDFTGFVLDCDGVVWHGDEAIPGSVDACNQLLSMGMIVHFVTNSSSSRRSAVAQKLQSLGVEGITEEHITTSGSAAANVIRRKLPNAKKAYVIGEQGLVDELRLVGLHVEGGPGDDKVLASSSAEFSKLKLSDDVDIVVCGLDRKFTYGKLAKASLYLQQGRPLLCTNMDAYDVLPPKGNVPGAGCLAAALIASHPQAVREVAGKPSGELLLDIISRRGMDKARTIMIGDRIDTDIEFAHNAGVSSCLVLTGVSDDQFASRATFCRASLVDFIAECVPH